MSAMDRKRTFANVAIGKKRTLAGLLGPRVGRKLHRPRERRYLRFTGIGVAPVAIRQGVVRYRFLARSVGCQAPQRA